MTMMLSEMDSLLGVFSRAEQRVLQAILRAIAQDGGRCVATLAMLARNAGASRSTTRNAINQAVAIGLLAKIERRSYCAPSLPNILMMGRPPAPRWRRPSPLELSKKPWFELRDFLFMVHPFESEGEIIVH
jgi:hypothetical protein